MPGHDAFLGAVAEKPDDDGPRLVYADWLAENGDPDRAEFIRAQCELASPKLAKKRRDDLRVRERELLETHRQAWCKEFGVAVEDVSFERGMIAGVSARKKGEVVRTVGLTLCQHTPSEKVAGVVIKLFRCRLQR